MSALPKTFLLLLTILTLLPGCSLFSRSAKQTGPSDAELQAEVQKALQRDSSLSRLSISVGCVNGVIELSGPVKSLAVKSRAGLVAASVSGVIQVHNDLLTPAAGSRD